MTDSNSIPLTRPNVGFYISILTLVTTVVTFGIAIFTPPISGPFCAASCIAYPYTDVLSRFPKDYYWMYPAIPLCVLFVALMAVIHDRAKEGAKVFSLLGVCFAVMSSTLLAADYFLQLSVVQPSLVAGESAGIALFSQYNPHGVFIGVEEIAYLLMAMSMCCAAPLFAGRHWARRTVKWAFALPLGLSILALVGISSFYGIGREYRFEVAVITIDWLALIVASSALGIVFWRTGQI